MFYHGREKLKFVGLLMAQANFGKDKINVENAECSQPKDKEMILREIVSKHGSIQVFNEKLKNKWDDVKFGLNL